MKGIAWGRILTDDGSAPNYTAADLDALVASGVQTVRFELRATSRYPAWGDILLGNYRTAVQALSARGIASIGLVAASVVSGATQAAWNLNNTENTPGGTGTNPFADAYMQAAASIVGALSPVIHTWEVWNEPNCYSTRSGTVYTGSSYIYPSVYVPLLQRFYTLAKAVDPLCTVLTGGLFAHDIGGYVSVTNSGATYLSALLSLMARAGVPFPFDRVGYHLYLDQGTSLVPGRVATYLGDILTALQSGGAALEKQDIIVTEAGWSTRSVTPDVQASNLTQLFTEINNQPEVSAALWFLLHDNTAAGQYFGLCAEVADAPKPAYTAFQAVATAA